MDLCTGFNRPEHTHPESDLTADLFLCPSCDAALNATIAADRRAAAPLATECPAGGHAAGSQYYTCFGCYAD